MLAPPALPEWLPSEVAQEVERIERETRCDTELVRRLATDKRMRTVWRELLKQSKGRSAHLRAAWEVMKGRLDVDPPDSSNPLVLFFWLAYTIKSLGVTAGTVSVLNLPIAHYELEAARLRLSAANLRKYKLQYGEEIVEGGSQMTDGHVHCIEDAAQFCDETVDTLKRIKALEAPLIVKRNYGNLPSRGYVRALAVETKSLFGTWHRGSLATVASVVLKKKITDIQVRKWCDSLKLTMSWRGANKGAPLR